MQWGLLGPEQLAGSRRTRPLGLGSAVRKFNQLAVPGLGGVWFAKQLFLATLGVIVADRLRQISRNVKTIEIANAVEALPPHDENRRHRRRQKKPDVEKRLDRLRRAAQSYLDERADPTEGKTATAFCLSCVETDPAQIIRSLVLRDNHILLLHGNDILPFRAEAAG